MHSFRKTAPTRTPDCRHGDGLSERRPIRPVSGLIGAVLSLGLCFGAQAHEQNGAPNAAGTQATTPSGVTITLSQVDGPASACLDGSSPGGTTFTANGAAFNGNPPANYDPGINTAATSFNLTTAGTAGACQLVAVGGEVVKGTVTLSFSQPVTNPRLHFARVGGINGTEAQVTAWTLANGATGTTADMTAVAGAMTVIDEPGAGTRARLQTTSNNPTTACGNPATTSGCGTIRVNGTYTVLSFNVALAHRSGTGPFNQAADAYGLIVSIDEDFADAPASYGAASHAYGDLAIGSGGTPEPNPPVAGVAANTGVSADTATTMYATTAALAVTPLAGAAASTDTDNGLASLAAVAGNATTHTLTVPVSGASKAGQLCGWIDFNRNGSFDGGESACAALAANAASANLNWTLPAGNAYVAGNSYLRLRAVYGATAPAATGAADSGEVEDHRIALQPRLRVNKAIVPNTDGGRFNLSINPAPAAAFTANNQGHGGSTGFQSIPLGSAVAVAETAGTATNLGAYRSSLSCTNRAGATVLGPTAATSANYTYTSASTSGASSDTPATSANIDDTELTCVFTNTLSSDLSVTKTNTFAPGQASDLANDTVQRGPTTYTLVVTNNGLMPVTGAVVRDTPGAGIACAAGNAVTITGNGIPGGGPYTVGHLTGAGGIVLGALGSGQSATLSFQCTVQ
ncbi:GEVED domain-containing protein [Lysobacter silvisoli]|nr:GEVED domain-containing protein [Lysobacter silvisoli]